MREEGRKGQDREAQGTRTQEGVVCVQHWEPPEDPAQEPLPGPEGTRVLGITRGTEGSSASAQP